MTSLNQSLLHHDHHHRNDDEDGMSDVIKAKLTSMAVLFCASMICGSVPIVLARRFKWVDSSKAANLKNTNMVVVCLLAFGGGVLLATTFLHLVPEVQENIEILQALGKISCMEIDLAALLICAGFFIMYLVEELVHVYIHYKEKNDGKASDLVRTLSIRRSQRNSGNITNSRADLIDEKTDLPTKNMQDNNGFSSGPLDVHVAEAHAHSHSHGAGGHGHSHVPTIATGESDIVSALRGLLIVLALSIHELFEGLAVGLESSSGNVWYMLGAVSAHKLVIAFCIGVELIAVRTKTWLAHLYIFTFAVVSPMGIGVGILLVGGSGAAASGPYSVYLQGLASGTLLYVIFFEIWVTDRKGLLTFISSVIGFGLMLVFQLLLGHAHSHGSYEDDENYDESRCSHTHSHSHNN